jgi:hypothetical protein
MAGHDFKGVMFLIAGVQPKTRRVDDNPQRCPSCGLAQAYTTRVDHYLSLFFIPLIRVKKGAPFLLCDRCGRPLDDFQAPAHAQPPSGAPPFVWPAKGPSTVHLRIARIVGSGPSGCRSGNGILRRSSAVSG